MDWYKTLNIHQRINLIECCDLICGESYDFLRKLFSKPEIIEILYNKLVIDGLLNFKQI